MNKINILPTDKPSRLRYFCGKLQLMYVIPKKSDITFQNIYITSDVEIKEGDYNACYDFSRKIILTTDQDLIKGGVQAIDDEFLEWFVKNPSCEEVEVKKWSSLAECGYSYHIIIPKEEPKQETLKGGNNE